MDQKVKIKLLFFGVAKEMAALSETELSIAAAWQTVDDLLKFICEKFDLSVLKSFVALALNEEYLMEMNKPIVLKERSVLALIPPINGG